MATRTIIIILIAANLPIYVLVGWVVFGGWAGFIEALWDILRSPSSESLHYGEAWEKGYWAHMKLLWFLVSVAAVIGAEYWLVSRLF